jgi:flagellar protein FliO/FliZ
MLAGSISTSVAALLAVLGVMGLAHHAVRRGWIRLPSAPGRAGQKLAVIETLALDTNRRVHLIRVDGRHVAVLTGAHGDLVLGWLPENAA